MSQPWEQTLASIENEVRTAPEQEGRAGVAEGVEPGPRRAGLLSLPDERVFALMVASAGPGPHSRRARTGGTRTPLPALSARNRLKSPPYPIGSAVRVTRPKPLYEAEKAASAALPRIRAAATRAAARMPW